MHVYGALPWMLAIQTPAAYSMFVGPIWWDGKNVYIGTFYFIFSGGLDNLHAKFAVHWTSKLV